MTNRHDDCITQLITKDEIQVFHNDKCPPKQNLVIKKLKQFGSGGQADVFKCQIFGIQTKFFVDKTKKIHNNEELANEVLTEMLREFITAKDLSHPHIIQYLYFMKKFDKISKMYEIHILMELMEGGDMEAYIKCQKSVGLELVKRFGTQILEALVYLHSQDIIHQDIKPANIMFDKEQRNIKLIDLGVSSKIEHTKITKAAAQGTIRYMPPEQLNGQLSFKSDVWAFGCVILQLCTGVRPFDSIENEVSTGMKIAQGLSPLDHYLTSNDFPFSDKKLL